MLFEITFKNNKTLIVLGEDKNTAISWLGIKRREIKNIQPIIDKKGYNI